MQEVILGHVDDLGSTIVYWTLPENLLGNQVDTTCNSVFSFDPFEVVAFKKTILLCGEEISSKCWYPKPES